MGSHKDGCMHGHREEVLLGLDHEASEDLWTGRSEGGQVGPCARLSGWKEIKEDADGLQGP